MPGCRSGDDAASAAANANPEPISTTPDQPGLHRNSTDLPDSPARMQVERPVPRKPEMVPARGGGESIEPLVRAELARAERDGRDLIIYVGAKWCEPCQRFKTALKSGRLDKDFPTLRVLEFDLDRDRARLKSAGCSGRMIPLFARPQANGQCGEVRFEGAVKGPEAIDNIKPRLAQLIAKTAE